MGNSREGESNMQAAAPEVLAALRDQADPLTNRPDDTGEWRRVILGHAQGDWLAAGLLPQNFASLISYLENQGYYTPIDDEHGWVRMND
jgi:hypothetical protein